MSTEDVKKELQKQTKIAAGRWKRVNKKTLPDGSEVRVFEDSKTDTFMETIEKSDGTIEIKPYKAEVSENPIKDDGEIAAAHRIMKRFYGDNGLVPGIMPFYGWDVVPYFFDFCFKSKGAVLNDINDSVKGLSVRMVPRVLTKKYLDDMYFFDLLDPFLPFNFKETSKGFFEILDEVSFTDFMENMEKQGFFYSHQKCHLSALADARNNHLKQDIADKYPDLYAATFEVEKKRGMFFLVSADEPDLVLGPVYQREDFDDLINLYEVEIDFKPEDLIFDVLDDDGMLSIHLDSKLNPGHDNLGAHNVSGLPLGLDAEDMECCWSVDGYTKKEVIAAMKAAGFTYEKFL